MKLLLAAFVYFVVKTSGDDDSGWSLKGNPLVAAYPCNGSTDIQIMYEPGRAPEDENKYDLWIHKKFPKHTVIILKFDKGASVKLNNRTFARLDVDKSDDLSFRIRFFESHDGIGFHVQGCIFGIVTYLTSVNINTKEYCQELQIGFLDSYIEGYKYEAQSSCINIEKNDENNTGNILEQRSVKCGKRQPSFIPLQANGVSERNNWPWHTALFLKKKYLCGGTLISNQHVLTAAHCVSERGVARPSEEIIVALGRYNLHQISELGAIDEEVERVIIHEYFLFPNLNNDIALLKLKKIVTFSAYIQPACLWYENMNKNLQSGPIIGTIVGWGYNEDNTEPNELNQLQMPMISDAVCIRNKPGFYAKALNGFKFCAGDLDVAVPCNGDSGGGFHVFIPDQVGDNSTSGSWHIRGIISFSAPNKDGMCSTEDYTVFTDVEKYTNWISSKM